MLKTECSVTLRHFCLSTSKPAAGLIPNSAPGLEGDMQKCITGNKRGARLRRDRKTVFVLVVVSAAGEDPAY